MKDELADVLIYAILFANEAGIDIEEASTNKLSSSKHKYPVNKAFGSNKKYSELEKS